MNSEWIDQDARHCWHPYTQHGLDREPLAVVGASGATLELADGRRLIDAISSWWTCLHGHGHPALVEALARQAARLDHVLFAGCTHEPAARLAEGLVGLAARMNRPGDRRLERVFYSDDGSTAVEVALKAAYQSWVRRGETGRQVFLALEGGYHGDTFGAMSVGDPQPFFREFAPLLFEVQRISPSEQSLMQALELHRGRVAGLIVEPLVQGAAGMVMHSPDFLRAARRLCDEHSVFLIADEVMTGFGRTGTVFACQQAQITPDLMCLAKGITGGMLPLAATLATEEVFQAFLSDDRAHAFFHGHSFTANPLGCAVGLASLAVLEADDTPARLTQIGRWIRAGLDGLEREAPVREIRHLGGIVAVELEATDSGYLSNLGDRLRAACRTQDVLLRPLGNVIYAIPPGCTGEEECGRIVAAMRAVCVQSSLST